MTRKRGSMCRRAVLLALTLASVPPAVGAQQAAVECIAGIYPKSVWEARAALARLFPRYACFVVRPAEAGRAFVVAVHRMTRQLDEDPYTDTLWGILTGYEAADALRIARQAEPLIITRGAAGTGLDLKVFDSGCWFSEGERGAMWEKKPGGEPEKKKVNPDTTKALVDAFNVFKTQLFLTSGHATARDWQIGYSYKNGQFRCQRGQLFGLDLNRKVHPINSPNPKVYLPVGNCLMGLIPNRDCMALAFMRTGGVHQMVGYTVATWYGYGGWGIKDLFIGQPGRYTLSEAFYANNQALVHRLVTEFPRCANANVERYDLERDRQLLVKVAMRHGLIDRKKRRLLRDPLGLLWDRDTVAFYGDPAWDARLKPRPLPWDTRLTVADGLYTFELVAHRDGGRPRPPLHFLPHRVREVAIVEGADLEPLITDNFLLLPKPTKFEKGKTYRVVFKARRIPMPDAASSAADDGQTLDTPLS